MNTLKTLIAAVAATTLSVAAGAGADPVRDCLLEGTLKNQPGNADKVYVAFHSARPAEEGANCRMRRKEKLQFAAPVDAGLQAAKPGTRVEYRFTEDSNGSATWKLQNVSS